MIIENRQIKPVKWWANENIAHHIFKLVDDWVNYNNKEKYDRRWQTRCDNCISLCCYFSISGYRYDYRDDKDGDISSMQYFFENEFVIMSIKNNSWEDNVEMGFNITVNPIEFRKGGLQICPLTTLQGCLIYENRPKICREWRCIMSIDKYLGTK